MWKYGKRILMTIFLLALVLSFCSCSNKEEEEGEEEEEKVVVNYADINEITILNADDLEQTGFLLDEFNLSEIKLHITYLSSEETVDVPVTENMVRAEDKAKLSVAGTHSITLYYGKFTIEFKLRLFRTLENVHRVTFMDWEGNRLGDVQYLKEGQIATVPNLESRQGFQFLGWQNSETGEIVTSFVFSQDVTLVASYAPEYYSVDYYYRIGDDEVYLSSEWVKRGADAYDYAPAIPIVEGYSNGHWSDTLAMKNVDRDGLKFYAVFDKDYVNATFVYYKFVEGEWYSYDVYWKVSEASEGISAPDDVRRVSSDIFLYWYIKHGNAEVRVDFPYVLTAETTFYAKYIPAEQGSSGIEVRYVDAENGSVDKEGYYIVAYDGDDDIIAVPTSISFASDKRYMFVRRSVTVGSMIRNKYYNRADGYLYKSEDEYAQDKEYYERICVGYENDTYFVYMPQTVVPGEYVQPNTYYDIVDGEYHLTEENYFLADKNYYIKKNAVIRSGEFYLEESIPVGTELEADTYYYFRDNTFILLTERTQARIRYVYYTKITGLTINGTSLFAEENRMLNAKASVCCVPQNKTMLLGLMGHPFASNGAKRFFVANDNTVFRVNNDSLYSVDLKTLYAYPTGRTAETYKVETKRLTIENIADYAFYGAKLLRSVILPDTILNIGEYAFAECAALTSFTVPASVEHIGRYAFYDDISVTEYNFDEGSALVTIGEFCFAKNHLLGSFALPSSVQSIGKGLFAGCVSLESINADSEYFTVDRANGGLYGQKDAMSYYYLYAFPAKFPGSTNGVITINSGARVVCTGAFSYTSLYEIAFESRNNSIIFESGSVVCPTLRTVRLNCTVLTVHDNMFDDPLSSYSFWPECFYLDHDTASALGGFLNDSAFRSVERREYSDIIGRAEYKPYSEDFGYVMVSNAGVQTVTITGYRGTATELVIPDNINNAKVTAIDDNAFRENKTIRTLAIPDSVESIGDYAFYGCDNLRSVSFGVGIKSIGTRAFFDCGSLIEAEYTDRTNISSVGEFSFAGTPLIKSDEFVIVGGVLIGYNGIADIVSIPDNVYVIADHTFENRLSVEKLIFGADSQLTTVCQYAFSGCANIAEIVFPANMQFIDDYAFADCPHLFAVVFLSDVEVRGSAFTGSGNVYSTGVTRTFGPSSLSYSYIFTGVSSGTGYYILKAPDGAGEQGAFEGWFTDETLSSGATFPLILTEDVVFHAGYDEVNPSTNGLVFSLSSDGYEVTGYTGTNKYVTVPSTYLGQKVVGIAENAFLDLDIVYFSLPDTIKRIGRNAFSGTTWLTLITDNTAVIGSYLIKYNGQQAEFRLPDGIRYIADGAFENNDSIHAFYTGNRLTVVPAYCFRNCINLCTVVLGKETTEIGAYAFADCASLQSVDFSAATHLNKVHYTAFDNSYWRTYYPDDSIVINKIYYAYIGSNDTLHVPNSVTLVNPYAFYGNNSIRYVYIPESVVTIGECAFAESSLEKIFFADSFSNLTTIERRAFYRCHSVVDFNFRFCNNLTSIGEEAFCGIKRKSSDILLTFYIPELTDTLGERVFAESDVYTVYFSEDNRLLELPRQAFYNCKLLVSVRFFGESFLQSIADESFCGCTSLSTFTDDRAFLSEIGERAFYGCSSLSMLGINETTLVTVGNNAFAGTSYVGTSDVMVFLGSVLMKYNGIQSTVYIPAETTEIANEAFIGNTRIASIEFAGEELVAIRYRAFMDCSSVTKIVLPSSIESIEEGAFAGCSSLTSFTIRTTGSDSGYISVSGVLFRYYTKNDRRYAELIAYPNKHAGIYEIPDSIVCDGKPFTVTSIAAYAFYNCVDLRQLTLPSGLVTIGNNAFYGCSSLQTLTLPATLKTIGAHAFASCSVMTSVSYAGTETDWNAIELGAVWMGALRTVETSSGNINTIADNTVYEMAGIQYRINEVGGNYYATVIGYEEGMTECVVSEYVDEIDVPVTAIAENCFADIVSPFALVLPGSIKNIGLGAFKDSVGITSVRFNGTVGDWCGIDFGDETSNPMQFADGFFIGGTLLTEAVVPPTVTAINKYAFVGCDSLTDVVLPASLLTVGEKAFAACRNVAYVNYTGDIASWLTITFADEYANPVYYARDLYIGGATLTSVVIPNEVVSVKDYVLSRCDSLETVSYEPNSHLTSIGRHAFSYSNGLLTVSLPASLLNIDEYAFYYCNSLTSADFAVNSALESIGAYAFSDCGALTDAVLPDGLMRISSYAFTDCVSLSNVYVPDSLVTIGSFVFDNCPIQTAVVPGPVASAIKNTALQSLTITTGTSIESNAFAGCGYLTTVVLAETITAVGADAFFGCPIESATLPADVCGCVKNSELRTLVIIGEGSIADNAFTGCANLESVAIGEGVTEIGSGAFSGCSALTLIEYGGTIAQWGNVIKGTDWDASAGAYVVRCTNGEI